MALIEKTSVEIIGKFGDRVYYYKNGELVSRAYVIPVQPGTPAQVTWWDNFSSGVTSWQALPQGHKKKWDKKAKPFRFSGFNLFMREWLLT